MNTVLIVDDSATARMMFKHWVSQYRADLTILEAPDGNRALEVVASLPDRELIVFLDYSMPGLEGKDMACQLLEYVPAQQVVLCTAMVGESVRKMASEMGLHYLPKPITPIKVKKMFEDLGL